MMILQPSVIATSAPLGALSIQTRLDVSLILIDVQKKKKDAVSTLHLNDI